MVSEQSNKKNGEKSSITLIKTLKKARNKATHYRRPKKRTIDLDPKRM